MLQLGRCEGSRVAAGWAGSLAVWEGKHAELNHLEINITAGPGAAAWALQIHRFSVCSTLGFNPAVHNPWPGKFRMQQGEVTVLKKWISMIWPRINSKQLVSVGSSELNWWLWELENTKSQPQNILGWEGPTRVKSSSKGNGPSGELVILSSLCVL